MSKITYDRHLASLVHDHLKKIAELNNVHANLTSRFNLGDVIKDKAGFIIRVDVIMCGFPAGCRYPENCYIGPVLDANRKVNPNGKQHAIYDSHAERIEK